MDDLLDDRPLWLVVILLFVVAMSRGHLTYFLARAAAARAERTLATSRDRAPSGRLARLDRRVDVVANGRGVGLIRRWGLIAVPLAYLTVGLQTLVLAGAGVLRVPWLRFTLAQSPGALVWAVVYATIGFAAWEAAVASAAGRTPPAIVLAGALLAVLLVVAALVTRRAQRTGRPLAPVRAEDVDPRTGTDPGA